MRTKKGLWIVVISVVCCATGVWLCGSIQGKEKTYEVKPQITIPQYQSETARVIDAYERLMDRYMDLVEANLVGVGGEMEAVAAKLDSIDAKLTQLCARMAEVEKALGIKRKDIEKCAS